MKSQRNIMCHAGRPWPRIWQRGLEVHLTVNNGSLSNWHKAQERATSTRPGMWSLLFLAINKWSSQTNKLNMHQSGHPGTLRDPKGSGTLKWRHYYQTIHEVCPLPLSISTPTSENRQWPLNLLSFESSCKPVTFSHWNGTKDTGKTVSALSTT